MGDNDQIIIKIGIRRFKTKRWVLRKSPIPYFAAIAEGLVGHEVILPSTFEDDTTQSFHDVLVYMKTGKLPLSHKLDRLMPLRKVLDKLSATLPSASRGYVIGGHVQYGLDRSWPAAYNGISSELLMYDPRKDTWVSMAPMISEREAFATCRVGTDIYVMGGNVRRAYLGTCDLVEKYNTITDTWTQMAPMYDPRRNHSAALVGKKIYVIGGGDSVERGDKYNYLQVYDTVENTWAVLELGNSTITSSNATTCVFGTDIYLFGGKNSSGVDKGKVKKFNTLTNVWTTLSLNFVLDTTNSTKRLRGSANRVGDDLYLIRPNGETFLFDLKKEELIPVKSTGPRVGGYTYVLDGCIYDVYFNYFNQTENAVAKGTIDEDNNITWCRIKSLPGNARETFGTASSENIDILDVAIIDLNKKFE
jgi:hypothetical protein